MAVIISARPHFWPSTPATTLRRVDNAWMIDVFGWSSSFIDQQVWLIISLCWPSSLYERSHWRGTWMRARYCRPSLLLSTLVPPPLLAVWVEYWWRDQEPTTWSLPRRRVQEYGKGCCLPWSWWSAPGGTPSAPLQLRKEYQGRLQVEVCSKKTSGNLPKSCRELDRPSRWPSPQFG